MNASASRASWSSVSYIRRQILVAAAIAGSAATGTRLPTLTVDTVIGFRSPEDRAAFATDLQSAVAALVARYARRRLVRT